MRQAYSMVIVCVLFLFTTGTAFGGDPPVSDATQGCLGCHAVFHPGIVADYDDVTGGASDHDEKAVELIVSRCRSMARHPGNSRQLVPGLRRLVYSTPTVASQ